MNDTVASGFFLTLEGGEGVGKSTAIESITRYLDAQQRSYIVTREPGGTPVAEQIRDVILQPQAEVVTANTELLLAFAARAQHLEMVIQPALQQGKVVVCDRFTDATFAYQGAGRELSTDVIEYLAQWLHGDCWPDLTLLLDASVAVGKQRVAVRGDMDRIEQEHTAFFERVHQCYRERARQIPQRFRVIDASASLSAVQQSIETVLAEVL